MACNESLKPIVILALHTGMRRGEILNLKWTDIDFKAGVIIVRISKNGESREIPLRYSHLSPEHKRETIKTLDKLNGHYLDTKTGIKVLGIPRNP